MICAAVGSASFSVRASSRHSKSSINTPRSVDDLQSHIEPKFFVKAFSIVGAIVAVGAVAALITWLLVEINRWQPYQHSIFGLAFGICARLFQASVGQGIKANLASSRRTEQARKMLGEQLVMLRVM